MSEDKEVLRAQIESLIYGLEDAVETLKETSDTGLVSTWNVSRKIFEELIRVNLLLLVSKTAHDMIARDLDLSIDITEELDKVPSKFVRKNDMQMKTEKLRVMTETAKQEVEGEQIDFIRHRKGWPATLCTLTYPSSFNYVINAAQADLAGSIGETLELLKKAALHPEGEKKESNS